MAFERGIPVGWVYRRKDGDDYGIDGEVEVFDAAHEATGIQFLVQLKATDEEDVGKALRRSILHGHASYYRSLALPVLMVRYVDEEEALYTKWFHSYDSYGTKPDARSLTFRWATEDRWTDARPAELAAEARAFLALRSAALLLPMGFDLDIVTSDAWGLTPAEISIALRAAAEVRRDVVRMEAGEPTPGGGRLVVRPNRLAVELATVTSATLHIDERYAPGPLAETLARDVLALGALAFEHVGQGGVAGRMAWSFLAGSSLLFDEAAVFALAAAMSNARMVREALELSEALDTPTPSNTSVWFTTPALAHARSLSPDEVEHYRRTLRARIERREAAGELIEAAREYHNLANHHRNRAEPVEAVELYERARKRDPEYEQRQHFWEEYAGVLFGAHRYDDAVTAYERALDLGADSWSAALRADALLFTGRYADALEAFAVVNSTRGDEGRDAEWELKARVLHEIVEVRGIDRQARRSQEAERLAGTVAEEPQPGLEQAREILGRALEFDALSPLAWVNLGFAAAQTGEEEAAGTAFLAAAALAEWDAPAWACAFMYAALTPDPELARAILVTGRRLSSGNMVPQLIRLVREQPDGFPYEEFLHMLNKELEELAEDLDDGYALRSVKAGHPVETIEVPGAAHRPAAVTVPDVPPAGRNDPCPCGSGRKYKKCHGA